MPTLNLFAPTQSLASSTASTVAYKQRGLLHLYTAELLLRRRGLLADARVTKDGPPHNDFHFEEQQAVNTLGTKHIGEDYKNQAHKVSLRTYEKVAALMLKKNDMEGEVELGIWAVTELSKAVVYLKQAGENRVVERVKNIGMQLCLDGGFEDAIQQIEDMKRKDYLAINT